MPATKDRAKLGTIAWVAQIHYDDGEDPIAATPAYAVRPNKGLAKVWMNANLGRHRRPGQPGRVWGQVDRGHYEDDSFTDTAYGEVLDATWVRDERPGSTLYAQLADNGIDVEWDET